MCVYTEYEEARRENGIQAVMCTFIYFGEGRSSNYYTVRYVCIYRICRR